MDWLTLPTPVGISASAEKDLFELANVLNKGEGAPSLKRCLLDGSTAEAAARVLVDLYRQGWAVRANPRVGIEVHPAERSKVAHLEKGRVRRQELLKRDEQLRQPSVVRFVRRMETPQEHNGRFVSIFDLMRDGHEFAALLRGLRGSPATTEQVCSVVDPYIQIVHAGDCDPQTGLKLSDVWRYFRHTWSNQYTTVPGRTMCLLVRDRSVEYHPVIGIAALSSAIIQLDERDRWIGWRSQDVLAAFVAEPTAARARWLVSRLEGRRREVYVDDLVRDDLFWPGWWDSPTRQSEALLRAEATARRFDHQRFARRSIVKGLKREDSEYWIRRAESDLYRSKRCLLLADLMRDKTALKPFLYPSSGAKGLSLAMEDRDARRAVLSIARRAKADAVGTEIADLSVCGAVAPYGELIGGKLIAMLAMSPTVVSAYHRRYRDYESEIASSVAGRPISRDSKLVYIGTTSLYGTTSSQYNRVRIPATVLDAKADIRLERLGRSRAFGTSHLSAETVVVLAALSEQTKNGVRVNSLFGEGVSPKLRKVRSGLDALGWPSTKLLQHGRQRIIYGVSLVENLNSYLLGMNSRPRYLIRTALPDDVKRITAWWAERWLLRRLESDEVLSRVANHSNERPVGHGARVPLPPLTSR